MFIKNKYLEFIVFALLFAAGGFYAATTASSTSSHHAAKYHNMAHPPINIPAGTQGPTVRLTATKDPMSGWNLEIITENFRFAPEHASQSHIPGEGHAHLYVNDVKIARVYGPWFHLAKLPPGEHTVSVSLNANTHGQYSVNNQAVSDKIIVSSSNL
ncbi:MAG: hypothetical protein KDJ99_33255 [Candidatus Competibacteraceae bacterium]|nr:hypothetical protein [Candidatus Competibacteraceae bacterium]